MQAHQHKAVSAATANKAAVCPSFARPAVPPLFCLGYAATWAFAFAVYMLFGRKGSCASDTACNGCDYTALVLVKSGFAAVMAQRCCCSQCSC